MSIPPQSNSNDEGTSKNPIPNRTTADHAKAYRDFDADATSGSAPQGDELFNHIVNCLDNRSPEKDIRMQLIAFGYAPEDAEKTVRDVVEWRRKNPPSLHSVRAKMRMKIGGIVCLIGVVVIIGSCLSVGKADDRLSKGILGFAFCVSAWGAMEFGRGYVRNE